MSRSVAVVVVHGVADQEPKASARQIATLLTDFTESYPNGFTEEAIRVPLEPVLDRSERTPKKAAMARVFTVQEQSDALRNAGADVGLDFMYEQLRDYDSAGGVFETACLEGKRTDGTTVHVYEAYWADLSRLGTGLIAFFGELYQLLLHLPSLGRTVVAGEAALRRRADWNAFAFFQRWLVRWLTLFIAPINLVMLTFVLPLLATQLEVRLSTTLTFAIALSIALTIAVAAAGLALRRFPLPRVLWAIAPFVAAAAASLVGCLLVVAWTPTHVVVLEAWAISAALIVAALIAYNERRPGALVVGVVLLLAAGVVFVTNVAGVETLSILPAAVLRAIEVMHVSLRLAWVVHVPWLVLTMIAAGVCIARSREERARAVRVSWVAIVSVGLASTAFALLTPAFWSAILTAIGEVLPRHVPYDPLDPSIDKRTVGAWVEHAVLQRASQAFVVEAATLLAFLCALVWSIFPSVIVEARPPQSSTRERAIALGRWLSHGLGAIPWAALIVPAGLVSLIAVLALDIQFSTSVVVWAGGAVLAMTAARFWLPGASSALDVALDVDNYLREHPRRSTPRARIAERFFSLLRFIHRAPRRYDATVIIAHSQGTVIAADLLRFLKEHGIAFTSGPVDLFTMGSPLRQLYARAFSPLYLWVDPDVKTTQSAGTIDPRAKPDPEDLGVVRWVNAYRTGDYVGRNLWCNRAGDEVFLDGLDTDEPSRRRELCIGEGAHTHYWDREGKRIATMLDTLLQLPRAAS